MRARFSWTAAAATIGQLIPRARLDRHVLGWVEQDRLRPKTWTVALSGGADSVALLLLLWAHWPERRRHLRAVHFDHRLRGTASRADAAFCRKLCASLGVPLAVGVWVRPRSAARPSEAEAREARLAFFRGHARHLWLAHHMDDVAETMLMRLARGSGVGGLAAPRPVQPMPGARMHLRPLLGIKKAELMDALRVAGAPWCHDATNDTGVYFRNRVRRAVLPVWCEAAQRDAVGGAARTRELLEEDDVALDAWVEAIAPLSERGDLLVARVRGKPRAIVRRALHRWFLGLVPKVDVSRQAFEALLEAVERGVPTRHSLDSRRFAVLRGGRLTCEVGKPRSKFQRRVN